MKTKALKFFPLICAAVLACWPTQARATIALDYTQHFAESSSPDVTRGWDFTLSSAVLVTDLGVWDGNTQPFGTPGDGLAASHIVTIWNSTSMLALAQATVPSSTAGSLVDDFRYVSLTTPVLLLPGSYVIGAYYNLDDFFAASVTGITTAPEVTFAMGRSGNGNAFPNSTDGNSPYLGPNFQFAAAPPPNGTGVPEGGSSWMLMGISLGGILALRFALQRRSVI